MTKKKLTIYQAYWEKFLWGFSFIIFYIADKNNTKLNILIYYSYNNLANYNNSNKLLL